MNEYDLLESLGDIDAVLINEAYERNVSNSAAYVVSERRRIQRIAVALCSAAVCVLLAIVTVPLIRNAISDADERISSSSDSYISMHVEEKAMFCPAYMPDGFFAINAEFEDDPTLGGIIEYSDSEGDVITFSYEKMQGEITFDDNCEVISIGDNKGYFNSEDDSLMWESNGYILKITGISDSDEMRKTACGIKYMDKISVDVQTTTSFTETTQPIKVTENTGNISTHNHTTTSTATMPQQVVLTSTFYVPEVSITTSDTAVTTDASAISSALATTTSTATAYTTAKTTAATTVTCSVTSRLTTTTLSSTTVSTSTSLVENTVVSTTTTTTAATTAATTTTSWPVLIEAETKYWRQSYSEYDTYDQIIATEFPCMTIVRSMEQLEALNGTIYGIDFEGMYSYTSNLTEDYLTDEFFAEHDFVIFLNYDTSASFTIGIQSARITENHVLEVTVSHYHPEMIDCSMEMYALGIAVPKGSLNQVGGYAVTWEYFGYSEDVAEGDETFAAYKESIPDVLYIENELE